MFSSIGFDWVKLLFLFRIDVTESGNGNGDEATGKGYS